MFTETINVCIPIYNEEKNLQSLYDEFKKILPKIEQKYNINLKLVFFDDGSIDNSRLIIKNFNDVEFIFSDENKGLGYAIKELIKFTKNSEACGLFKIDGDGQMNFLDLEKFLNDKLYKKFDVIYGNRFHKYSQYKMPFLRKFGSNFFKYFLKIFSINISDPTNGFIFLSKKYIVNSKIIGNYNAAQQILLDAQIRKLKIIEVDVDLQSRSSGQSFIGLKYPIIVISNLLALYVYKKTAKVLIAPGVIILLIGLIILIYNVFLWSTSLRTQIISDQVLVLLILFGAQLSITGFIIEIIKNKSD